MGTKEFQKLRTMLSAMKADCGRADSPARRGRGGRARGREGSQEEAGNGWGTQGVSICFIMSIGFCSDEWFKAVSQVRDISRLQLPVQLVRRLVSVTKLDLSFSTSAPFCADYGYTHQSITCQTSSRSALDHALSGI